MTRSGLRKVGARWDSQRTGTGISADEHLARSWRRVASTHTLQQLIAPEDAKGGERSLTKKLKGLSMLILALTLLMMHVAHAAALWLPPSALPPFLLLIRKHSQLLFHTAFIFHGTAIAVFLHWFSLKLFKHNSS
ncbi:hypothetical protein Vretimale_11853 [Volvox reticuliferus]|uniref:Uncharacterized protein n=1 Tax=Volvox reticuliferus TaxID=1737510 RepID=A0A8J4CIB6_9CHLO|nr:hypothetical protein Vretifemale_11396 [Volvox reticuliferus]GIM07779.1 hypothetical protein Vretimale_11853 [Volvox reticuliferus]